MMIGGDTEAVAAPRSHLQDDRAGARQRDPPHSGPGQGRRHRRGGLSALRPLGRGPLRQDGPQRHRVRDHGGLRRRVEHPQARQRRQDQPHGRRRDDAAAQPRALPVRPQPARRRRGLAARQRHRLVAAGSDRDRAAQVAGACELLGPRLRLGRRALDDHGGDRRGRTGRGPDGVALRALRVARARPTSATSSCRPCASSSAGTSRRRLESRTMADQTREPSASTSAARASRRSSSAPTASA